MTGFQIIDATGLVAVAILFGSMFFFSCIVAPLVFMELELETAGRFIRRLFPWYYAVVGGLALLCTACLAAERQLDAVAMALVLFGAVLSRQILMPRINRYRDRMVAGDAAAEESFERLHNVSVWINSVQLFATFTVLIRMALV